MRSRTPARYLAPLALVAVIVAVFLVLRPAPDEPAPATSTRTASTPSPTSTSRTTRTSTTSSTRRSYTVQPGDSLSVVAEKTGVPVARLQELNPDVDANALRVGQKLKLSPAQ